MRKHVISYAYVLCDFQTRSIRWNTRLALNCNPKGQPTPFGSLLGIIGDCRMDQNTSGGLAQRLRLLTRHASRGTLKKPGVFANLRLVPRNNNQVRKQDVAS